MRVRGTSTRARTSPVPSVASLNRSVDELTTSLCLSVGIPPRKKPCMAIRGPRKHAIGGVRKCGSEAQ
eukprot:3074870-Pleurochrysis_carterae.AAC.1